MSYHKKVGLVGLGIFLILVLTGALCSKKTTTTQEGTPSSLFPYVEKKEPITPGVSPYQKPPEDFTTPSGPSKEELLRQAKIGKIINFRYPRYGISGNAQILSPTKIKIQNFNYSGGCQNRLILYLTRANLPTEIVAILTPINQPQNNVSFDVNLPSSLDLLDFDSLAIRCEGQQEPVAVANF